MVISAVLKAAEADADAARAVINAEYQRLSEAALLSFVQTFKTTARLVFIAQVRIAGAIDTRTIVSAHGVVDGFALRNTLTISQADARARVTTAKATLPQPSVSGVDPVLPLLPAALSPRARSGSSRPASSSRP